MIRNPILNDLQPDPGVRQIINLANLHEHEITVGFIGFMSGRCARSLYKYLSFAGHDRPGEKLNPKI